MGRLWNEQPCKCKECGKEFGSINQGKGHVWLEHKVPFHKTREYLEKIEE